MGPIIPNIEDLSIDKTIDVIGRDRRSLQGPCVKRVCFTPVGAICAQGRWMDVYDFIRNNPDYNDYVYHVLVYVYGFVKSPQRAKRVIKRFVECHTPTRFHPSTFHLESLENRWVLVRHDRAKGENHIEVLRTHRIFPTSYIQALDTYQPAENTNDE